MRTCPHAVCKWRWSGCTVAGSAPCQAWCQPAEKSPGQVLCRARCMARSMAGGGATAQGGGWCGSSPGLGAAEWNAVECTCRIDVHIHVRKEAGRGLRRHRPHASAWDTHNDVPMCIMITRTLLRPACRSIRIRRRRSVLLQWPPLHGDDCCYMGEAVSASSGLFLQARAMAKAMLHQLTLVCVPHTLLQNGWCSLLTASHCRATHEP